MQTYILLTKLTSEFTSKLKDREELGREWLETVKEKCPDVTFKAHYALLGQFDFIDIYEAPNEESAAKVSMISQANGAFQAESLPAIPWKRFIALVKEL
ncbi:MAG: GYD domain-containing protein [Bacteroidales bacterium]|nr:GYD domain-containing protein [Bacteroidales bacterium]MCF8345198.1 GYD domain-containing protein [Bacteroidales bacterium]MCF8352416.1 GYD domain-containing protein [Bacteroidales bacterium]MCF8377138.1 GYD domain-containing protein [Bacteroidales bacterium]MCF8401044.1 GYD domain-containing protein [Bacteroidales bacterium]